MINSPAVWCQEINNKKTKDKVVAEALTIENDSWIHESQSEKMPQKIDFQSLWEINSDAYTYIDILDTEIYYPM